MASGRPRGSRSRRVSLPGVAELLRQAARGPAVADQRQASGRERHTQKITVYLSAAELIELERARLALRSYGLTVDRGRLVREAMSSGDRKRMEDASSALNDRLLNYAYLL